MIRPIDPSQSGTRARTITRTRTRRPQAAFTLVEIVLAIGLATVLLLLAMTFYQQASELRGRILRESERVSTLRLVLDRISGDLRATQPKAGSGNEFTGDSTSMAFVKEACASLPPGAPPETPEPTDLVRISLTTVFGTNEHGAVVTGIDRQESPLNARVAAAAISIASASATPTPTPTIDPADDPDSLSLDPPPQVIQVREPFAEQIRFVRFRYWSGTAWQAGWTNVTPPPGVEIVVSTTAPAENAEPDTLPPEALRRVVFVPGGVPSNTSVAADSSSSSTAP